MKLTEKTFDLFQEDGTPLEKNIRFFENGEISGAQHFERQYWSVIGTQIALTNQNKTPSILFTCCLEHSDLYIFFGQSTTRSEQKPRYILLERGEDAAPAVADMTPALVILERKLDQIRDTVNLVSQRSTRQSQKIKVLFLIHNISMWDSLHDIYMIMRESDNFEPVVATSPRYFPETQDYQAEEDVHQGLEKEAIPHIRFKNNFDEALQVIKAIGPDIIFRQMPWEVNTPESFQTQNLNFARLCYVPYYGLNILERLTSGEEEEQDFSIDQYFHRMCWRIYCENDLLYQRMKKKALRGGDNIVVSGHPKLDRLWNARKHPAWPIKSEGKKKFRLIWAPHHSVGEGWLDFGTFPQSFGDMLHWAENAPDIEFVLKPHPLLFNALLLYQIFTEAQVEQFKKLWNRLPNTALVEGGDYGPLLAASDAMITEGVSFLAEYQVFYDKPLIFLDSQRHRAFNEIGQKIMRGAYDVTTIAQAQAFIDNYRQEGNDPLHAIRKENFEMMVPWPGQAAKRIVDDIQNHIAL
ncbi:MAG: hypothetical protein ABF461_04465 [Zymomonas mobilis subsp. pomaceae]|uniref:hypothetical protein n=1 Tax=Zymomonas mobilis TaxID=542 RepID=UPI0039EB6BB6